MEAFSALLIHPLHDRSCRSCLLSLERRHESICSSALHRWVWIAAGGHQRCSHRILPSPCADVHEGANGVLAHRGIRVMETRPQAVAVVNIHGFAQAASR